MDEDIRHLINKKNHKLIQLRYLLMSIFSLHVVLCSADLNKLFYSYLTYIPPVEMNLHILFMILHGF